jgi:prophage maintenance system killer protein
MNGLISTYYKRIASASLPREKLAAIADLCQAIEVYHVFKDGNQRTIAFALLPKLLIENGFPPTILERPFMFDGAFTTEEMVLQIEQGIKRFSRLGAWLRKERDSEGVESIDLEITFQR